MSIVGLSLSLLQAASTAEHVLLEHSNRKWLIFSDLEQTDRDHPGIYQSDGDMHLAGIYQNGLLGQPGSKVYIPWQMGCRAGHCPSVQTSVLITLPSLKT